MVAEIEKLVKPKKVRKYFLERYNSDGGFTLVRPLESSVEETYYALYCLDSLGFNDIPFEKTLTFLENYQISSLRVAFFAFKTLKLLSKHISHSIFETTNIAQKLVNVLAAHQDGSKSIATVATMREGENYQAYDNNDEWKNEKFGTSSENIPFKSIDLNRLTLFEMPTKLEEIYYQIYVMKELHLPFEKNRFATTILGYKNSDGGFGSRNNSNIEETHYALLALRELEFPTSKIQDTIAWLRRCENEDGSFRINPYTIIEPSLDYIYYGVNALLALNETPYYKNRILRLIRNFQNGNGGFRRYIRFGVSKPEYTYQAIHTIVNLVE